MKRSRRYQPSLLLTFSVVSLVLIAALGVALALGIQHELERTALNQEAWVATDLVTNNIVPIVGSDDMSSPIKPGTARFNEIDLKIKDVMARNHIARAKIWAKDGTILYSDRAELIGQKFEVEGDLIEAFNGKIHSDVSNLDAEENQFERGEFDRLLELYLPLRTAGSATPNAVFEVYHDLAAVDARDNEVRNFTWLALSVGFLALYASLFALVLRASRTLTKRNREREQLYNEVNQRLAERVKAEHALRDQVEFERLVMSISTNFINLVPDEIDNGIRLALRAIGTFANVDRSYVFQFQDDECKRVSCTHEWCAQGVLPIIGVMQDLQSASFPWLFGKLKEGEVVQIESVNELPAEASAEKVFFQSVSNTSIVVVPLVYNKMPVGFLGFDFVNKTHVWPHESVVLLNIVGEIFVNALERKRAEDALRESEQRFRAVFEGTAIAIALSDLEGHIVQSNRPFQQLVGYTGDELTRLRFADITHIDDSGQSVNYFRQLIEGQRPHYAMEKRYIKKDGSFVWVNLLVSLLRDAKGNPQYSIAMVQDITERRRAQEEIKRQIERLASLRSIDNAITSSFDLHNTLKVILDQVVGQLHVDAADVLLLNQRTGSLEYVSGHGFRSELEARSRTGLGRGPAGVAALNRKMVKLPDLTSAPLGARAQLVEGEDFVAYYAVPLIAKGKVGGVLEVFKRSPLNPVGEWLDFLETLAGQTAIAVDNALLFQDLQRYNLELSLAYDTTLEGWSHALDLRDRETEGHTQRVTEMTVRLSRAMGLDDVALVHVRRGALLHDIGKMGIPDSILLKPGPLSEQEWATMRLHPVYAYELLSPIAFLHPALDIPYCHHEKWDGSGYPRGLSGEEIPLAARIFAVVDVFDALTSDRPYRAAWSEERAIHFIKAQTGIHFDPAVVDEFLRMDRSHFERTPTSPELVMGLLGLN